MTNLSFGKPATASPSSITLNIPPATKASDAMAWTGENRLYRVGDFTVAWIDMSKVTLLDRDALGISAAPEFFDGLDLLCAYIAVTGTFPTKDTIVNGYRVGKFVQRQRTGYRNLSKPSAKDKLPLDRIPVLENTVPGWHWDARLGRPLMHDLWFMHFVESLTPSGADYFTAEGRFGYDWIIRQEDAYRDGVMPLYRQVLFEARPNWRWRTKARPYPARERLTTAEIDPMTLAASEPFHDITALALAALIAEALDAIESRGAATA